MPISIVPLLSEEIGDFIPHASVDVEAVHFLQVLDRLLVLKSLRPPREISGAIARVAAATRRPAEASTVVQTWPPSGVPGFA